MARNLWFFGVVTFVCGVAAGDTLEGMGFRDTYAWFVLLLCIVFPLVAGRALRISELRTLMPSASSRIPDDGTSSAAL